MLTKLHLKNFKAWKNTGVTFLCPADIQRFHAKKKGP